LYLSKLTNCVGIHLNVVKKNNEIQNNVMEVLS